ncbi:hypothetical protein B9Z19DRAFT_1105584 [Tuber borchii]|uniref:Uncharacterized protein n=1 Tax=Tuber borchii TaxID=42251 RepID=A0A2T7A4V4_TUBBO|nr:hypothetical protein B9Z19DRAFT_1105584 [Tuber borchii]
MQRFSESEATLCRECEQKDILIKELEEEKATLIKQCEQKDTLLQWCKEQMTMSFERCDRQKAAFLREFEQEKAELPKLKLYEEWRYKPLGYSVGVDSWMKKLDEASKEALRRDREIFNQKVEQNPDLFAELLKEKRARQKLENTLQMRGLLRLIVDRAKQHNIIRDSPEAEIQEALNRLAQTREFTKILQHEAQARRLDTTLVMEYFHYIDSELSKPLAFQGPPITVREADFNDFDRAVLVILLKVQSSWPHPLLNWTEETSCKEGK